MVKNLRLFDVNFDLSKSLWGEINFDLPNSLRVSNFGFQPAYRAEADAKSAFSSGEGKERLAILLKLKFETVR